MEDHAGALEAARELVKLAPSWPDAALLLGDALLACGHLPAAVAEFQRAADLDPQCDAARFALGSAWLEAGETDRATEILAPIAAGSSPLATQAQGFLAHAEALRAAPRAPAGYVRHLFDQFSADYDRRMLSDLSYHAPLILRELADLIMTQRDERLAILDLGCGTGLSGEAFADRAATLIGVDLSPRMVEMARVRNIYSALVIGDVESVLEARGPNYDLIVAADTLVYLGDLGRIIRGAAKRLSSGGFFLFTVENKAGESYELGPKRRYRHSETYLRGEAAGAGLEVMAVIACSPRTEAGVPVAGLAVALTAA
jgi:predicted TPR repeat methyltransferase